MASIESWPASEVHADGGGCHTACPVPARDLSALASGFAVGRSIRASLQADRSEPHRRPGAAVPLDASTVIIFDPDFLSAVDMRKCPFTDDHARGKAVLDRGAEMDAGRRGGSLGLRSRGREATRLANDSGGLVRAMSRSAVRYALQ
jgi:hypothetical protein